MWGLDCHRHCSWPSSEGRRAAQDRSQFLVLCPVWCSVPHAVPILPLLVSSPIPCSLLSLCLYMLLFPSVFSLFTTCFILFEQLFYLIGPSVWEQFLDSQTTITLFQILTLHIPGNFKEPVMLEKQTQSLPQHCALLDTFPHLIPCNCCLHGAQPPQYP